MPGYDRNQYDADLRQKLATTVLYEAREAIGRQLRIVLTPPEDVKAELAALVAKLKDL